MATATPPTPGTVKTQLTQSPATSSSSSYAKTALEFSTKKKAKLSKMEYHYQLLSQSDVQAELDELATECASILDLSPAHCKILLRHYKWEKMVMLERFFEAPNPSKFLSQAGLCSTTATSNGAVNEKETCGICWEPSSSLLGLPCAHRFCPECWANYLAQKVQSEGQAYMSCPERGCDYAVFDTFARPLLARHGDEAVTKFNRLQLNSFVEGNPHIKWCPAAECTRAVKVEVAQSLQVKCDCGHSFCFQCVLQWHAPASCSLLRFWLKQCTDDSETYNWINAFTKDCPKCKTAIEKNGGCNHITCRSLACRFEFCWVCLEDWKAHGGNYSCNRFEQKQKNAEESRTALKRYLHYYDRFRNHENSLKLEHKLYERVAELTARFQAANFRHVETRFLRDAVDGLCGSRRTLMYTYAFAFYLEQQNVQTNIFEDNQQDLEVATEQLSEYLERDMEGEQDLKGLKQKVQDKTCYVEQRQHVLLEHCVENTERHEWCYNRDDIKPADGTVLNI